MIAAGTSEALALIIVCVLGSVFLNWKFGLPITDKGTRININLPRPRLGAWPQTAPGCPRQPRAGDVPYAPGQAQAIPLPGSHACCGVRALSA